MPDFNPNFPEVLGLEFLMNHDEKTRVWSGAPARMARFYSTVAEDIVSLKMSVAMNPAMKASIPTVVDVMLEGNEMTAQPKVARLTPNSDNLVNGWTDEAGGTTNLFTNIDNSTETWPSKAVIDGGYLKTATPLAAYACGMDASLFNTGGAAENGRVFWVGVSAITAANDGFRKFTCQLRINGVGYPPAGGSLRDTHSFGLIHEFWWGEINPATGKPWTPADIAAFDTDADTDIHFNAWTATTATHYPTIYAVSMNVAYLETENRVAVGTWRRPEDIGQDRLQNVETDALITLPAGTDGWAKDDDEHYLFFWRQSVSPSEYGPIIADDVRWNGGYQNLGPGGNPPNIVYPLTTSGVSPPPAGVLSTESLVYDIFGRPQKKFSHAGNTTVALAMVRDDAAISVDSQPYRMDISDLQKVSSTQELGQRMTPGSSQSYLGVRFPIIPPDTADSTLTIEVRRVSDNVLMGGTATVTAQQVRANRAAQGSPVWCYVTSFLSSAASLVAGTAYKMRFHCTGPGEWLMAMPDASLAPTTSFGGTTDGAYIGAAHQTDKDLAATLLRQPDPVSDLTASIFHFPVDTYLSAVGLPTVEHVRVGWTAPAVGMAGLFRRYEVDRSLDDGELWFRVANINNAEILSFDDHEVPREKDVKYRVRPVGTDGRFGEWVESNTTKPSGVGEVVIMTSNQDTTKEVVYFFDHNSTYPILSAEADETHRLYGSNDQVVFMESEDRGIGWHTGITVERVHINTRGGQQVFQPMLDLIRSQDVPYVCVLDDQGTHLMGHVRMQNPRRQQIERYYTTDIEVTPTTRIPTPVEIS